MAMARRGLKKVRATKDGVLTYLFPGNTVDRELIMQESI